MKRKNITVLLTMLMLAIFAGCGNAKETNVSPQPVVADPGDIETPPMADVPLVEEEIVVTEEVVEVTPEVEAEPNYAKDNNLEVKDFYHADTEVLFYCYNKDETGAIIASDIETFPAKIYLDKIEDDMGDGTKRVSYAVDINLQSWPWGYDYFAYEFYVVDTVTGDIFRTGKSNYSETHIYNEDYTNDMYTVQITVPNDYNDYAFLIRDVTYDPEMMFSADNLVAVPNMGDQFYILVH